MESTKFVGMDVHKDAITIAVMNVSLSGHQRD